MSPEGPRPRRWLFLAVLLGVAAVTLGLTVQAQREPPPVIEPYDPLPRW
jgi:hypothetical protein